MAAIAVFARNRMKGLAVMAVGAAMAISASVLMMHMMGYIDLGIIFTDAYNKISSLGALVGLIGMVSYARGKQMANIDVKVNGNKVILSHNGRGVNAGLFFRNEDNLTPIFDFIKSKSEERGPRREVIKQSLSDTENEGRDGGEDTLIPYDKEIELAKEFLLAEGYTDRQISGWLARGRAKLLEIAEIAGFKAPEDGDYVFADEPGVVIRFEKGGRVTTISAVHLDLLDYPGDVFTPRAIEVIGLIGNTEGPQSRGGTVFVPMSRAGEIRVKWDDLGSNDHGNLQTQERNRRGGIRGSPKDGGKFDTARIQRALLSSVIAVVFVGHSAAGKTVSMQEIAKRNQEIMAVVPKVTTREARASDAYTESIPQLDFEELKVENELSFVRSEAVNGVRISYGVRNSTVHALRNSGKIISFDTSSFKNTKEVKEALQEIFPDESVKVITVAISRFAPGTSHEIIRKTIAEARGPQCIEAAVNGEEFKQKLADLQLRIAKAEVFVQRLALEHPDVLIIHGGTIPLDELEEKLADVVNNLDGGEKEQSFKEALKEFWFILPLIAGIVLGITQVPVTIVIFGILAGVTILFKFLAHRAEEDRDQRWLNTFGNIAGLATFLTIAAAVIQSAWVLPLMPDPFLGRIIQWSIAFINIAFATSIVVNMKGSYKPLHTAKLDDEELREMILEVYEEDTEIYEAVKAHIETLERAQLETFYRRTLNGAQAQGRTPQGRTYSHPLVQKLAESKVGLAQEIAQAWEDALSAVKESTGDMTEKQAMLVSTIAVPLYFLVKVTVLFFAKDSIEHAELLRKIENGELKASDPGLLFESVKASMENRSQDTLQEKWFALSLRFPILTGNIEFIRSRVVLAVFAAIISGMLIPVLGIWGLPATLFFTLILNYLISGRSSVRRIYQLALDNFGNNNLLSADARALEISMRGMNDKIADAKTSEEERLELGNKLAELQKEFAAAYRNGTLYSRGEYSGCIRRRIPTRIGYGQK